jgi:hypothetical protein
MTTGRAARAVRTGAPPICYFCHRTLVHDVVQITVSVGGREVRTCRVCVDALCYAAELQDADAEADLETMWRARARRRRP